MFDLPWGIELLLIALALYLLACLIAFVIQDRLLFIPTVELPSYKYKIATPSEEWNLLTPEGGRINGLLITPGNSKGFIFYLHGNTGSIRRWRFMAEELSAFGYDVCVMDYRGYGKSKGKRNEARMHADVLHVFDHFARKYAGRTIFIYGRSLGTGFAVRLAALRVSNGLILETPFLNMLDVANFYFPFLPMRLLLRFRFRSDFWIKKVESPILMLHGTKDRIVPYSSALKLYKKLDSDPRVNMVTIQGGKHNNLNTYPLFFEKLNGFLNHYSGA